MPYFFGLILALCVCAFARTVGMDRDRAFYPIVVIVIASYYVLFALVAGDLLLISTELVIAAGFAAAAVFGFKRKLWFVVAALFTHAAFDCVHEIFLHSSGVPEQWPMFCFGFDLMLAASLGSLLWMRPDIMPNQERRACPTQISSSNEQR